MLRDHRKELFALADKGDDRALGLLIKHAWEILERMESLIERDPVRFHQWSQHEIRWPSFIGRKKVFTARHKRFMELLDLSKTCPLRHKWNPESHATQMAHQMIAWLEDNQEILALPEVSRETWEIWFEAGWESLLHATGGEPEKDPFLRGITLGISKERRKTRALSRCTSPRAKEEDAMLDGVIRSDLRTALKQGFETLYKIVISQPVN
jgi:hypothetical protein